MARFFADLSTANLYRVVDEAVFAERIARSPGLLQAIDPRVKMTGVGALVLAATLSRSLAVLAALFTVALLMAVASSVRPIGALLRLWGILLGFTLVVGLPALFLVPGDVVARLPLGLEISRPGLRTLAYLLGRVETTGTLTLTLILSTRWAALLRALRFFRVPTVVVVVLGMTYRYIFVLLQTAQDLFDGRRSRRLGSLPAAEARRLATGTAGALLGRTLDLSSEVYEAMRSRGFSGEARILEEPRLRSVDWCALGGLLALASAAIWWGR